MKWKRVKRAVLYRKRSQTVDRTVGTLPGYLFRCFTPIRFQNRNAAENKTFFTSLLRAFRCRYLVHSERARNNLSTVIVTYNASCDTSRILSGNKAGFGGIFMENNEIAI
jgi:hypothetical protein